MAAALLFAMLAAWAIAVKLLGDVAETGLDGRLENATATLADGTFPFSEELVERLGRLIQAHIVLIDTEDRLGLSTGDASFNAALQSALDGGGPGDGVITLEDHGSAWRLSTRALQPDRDDRYRRVVAAAPLAETRSAVRDAALLLAAAALVSALAAALFASYFVGSITRPVSDLARLANSISEGRRDVSAQIAEHNEIGTLAAAFNDMAARLADFEADLTATSRLSGFGDLAARMAHEIRNPLTAIKMQLELLGERVEADDRPRLEKVLDEMRRLELIVNSALALGGAESVNPAPTDAAALLHEVADLLGPALAHKHIRFETRIGQLPRAALDADRIKQVLLNLVNNAADELPDGGTIRLSAAASANSIVIRVADSGPGIQGDTSRSSKPLGLGVGLRISREIVTRHGGTLTPSGSAELGGAEFVVTLPALAPAAAQ